jgi:hypothetical protein
MFNYRADLLFPPRCLPSIREMRGTVWEKLIDQVIQTDPDSIEQLAIILLMSRLNNCLSCDADSYRLMTGCATCSRQSLKRCKESDEALLASYSAAKKEIEQFIEIKYKSHTIGVSKHHQEAIG